MGTAYMHVLMYAIHKMESMVGKCEVENAEGNAAAMYAWDEGVVRFCSRTATWGTDRS
jgi:hypothetical protein